MAEALIVDDSREAANSLQQMLGFLGISAVVAYGSRPGLEALKSKTPDVVFLDINMPGVDGFEVLAYLKRMPHLSDLPVIVITSEDQPETKLKIKEFGASKMILKPASLELLENALKEIGLLPT